MEAGGPGSRPSLGTRALGVLTWRHRLAIRPKLRRITSVGNLGSFNILSFLIGSVVEPFRHTAGREQRS